MALNFGLRSMFWQNQDDETFLFGDGTHKSNTIMERAIIDTAETPRTSQAFGQMRTITLIPASGVNAAPLWVRAVVYAKSSDGNDVELYGRISVIGIGPATSTTVSSDSTTYDQVDIIIDFPKQFTVQNATYLIEIYGRHTVAAETITITDIDLTVCYMDNVKSTRADKTKWSDWS